MEINNDTCNQWKGLVHKIAYKYAGGTMRLEFEDLTQIGFIGLLDGLKSYHDSYDVPLINYLSTCISNSIFKEIKSNKREKRKSNLNTISIHTPTNDDDITIADTLVDHASDIYQTVEDKIIYEFYEDMLFNLLDNQRAQILHMNLIDNRSIEYIKDKLKLSRGAVSYHLKEGKKELLRKSPYLREKKKEYYESYILSSSSIYRSSAENIAIKHLIWEV
ncbi:MAG: sigma-70 family RNA polymerase sigma factor [Peptostreptococcaceae bacterium]